MCLVRAFSVPLPYFKPVAPGVFVNFHPFLPASTRLEFERDAMRFLNTRGPMLAKKQG